jgi:[ribosomal protein S18]-alanine N-acetyltransferase
VVAERARRRGVADGLLEGLLRYVRATRGTVIWLEVRESNHPARRLYLKHGFHETGRRPRYYNSPLEDALLYELRLYDDSNAISVTS